MPGIDVVYHLAAAVGVKLVADDPVRTIETNIYPTELLLRLAVQGKQRVFLASTSEVYGKNPKDRWTEEDDLFLGPTSRPRWAYGCSKAIDEFLALAYHRKHALKVVVGRFFNVVGPRQVGHYGMVIPRFVEQALDGGPVVVYDDGGQVRCFAHVREVVECVVRLMETPAAVGRVFNIGSDEAVYGPQAGRGDHLPCRPPRENRLSSLQPGVRRGLRGRAAPRARRLAFVTRRSG